MFCESDKYLQVIAHLYRGEMNRLTMYRQRVDSISNWSMTLMLTMIMFCLQSSSLSSGHDVLFVMIPLVLFSFQEARRYQYYRICAYRIQLMEKGFFLQDVFHEPTDLSYKMHFVNSLTHIYQPISLWKSWCIRLHRNYIWFLYIIFLSWIYKMTMILFLLEMGVPVVIYFLLLVTFHVILFRMDPEYGIDV